MILENRRILIGMCGGIACYKAVGLLSMLKKAGSDVKVILTSNALNFITPLTVKTMSGNNVYCDAFDYDIPEPLHIELSKWAECFFILPATANTIAKLAGGISDNLLTDTALAYTGEIYLSPAMNVHMLENPATQNNLSVLNKRGYKIIEPKGGVLACGDEGRGRMLEPSELYEYIEFALSKKDFKGKKVIVTAGAGAEDIDPVRFITNRSTGRMGFAIAKAAALRGAEVKLIAGNTNLPVPLGCEIIHFRNTLDCLRIMDENFENADIIIQAAALSDFRVKDAKDSKIKKKDMATLNLELIANPDVAAHLGEKKGDRVLVGFAAETDDLKANAVGKIEKKNLDFIVANDVSRSDIGFKSKNNAVTIYYKDGREEELPFMPKEALADKILDRICLLQM